MGLLRRMAAVCALCVVGVLTSDRACAEAVLLDFETTWCGYCRMMEPVVAQLAAEGYKVRKIDGDQEPDLVRKYRIEGYPTFVALRDDQEVGRVSGKVTAGELKALAEKAGGKSRPSVPGTVRGQSPDWAATDSLAGRNRRVGGWEPAGDSQNAAATPAVHNPRPFIPSSVRVRIQEGREQSTGSGTIIDARDGEALILTCGHMFRECNDSGQILVDLFGPGAPKQLPGTLVSYDLNSDVGLVRIDGNYPFVAAEVAPASYKCQKGEPVVSVGCDNGADATERATQIVSIDRYNHAPNLQVAFEPVQGRSGGGLFNRQGQVIGVCNAADADEKQGLFASLGAIHAELDRAKLSFVYKVESRSGPRLNTPWPNSGTSEMRTATIGSPSISSPGELTPDERALLSELRAAGGTEVICLVRSLDDPQAKSRVFQINRASPAFWRELADGGPSMHGRKLTSLDRSISTGDQFGQSLNANPTPAALRKVAVPHSTNVWPPHVWHP
jgi:thiol-disulfide isomerase/thioredoxin